MSPASIRYRYGSSAPGVMDWVVIEYTTHISLVLINSNLNTDRYISDIVHPASCTLS